MKNDLSTAFNGAFNRIEVRPLNSKLAPCPFCGGDEIFITEFIGLTASQWGVFCRRCCIFTSRDSLHDSHATHTASISEWWNRRAKTLIGQTEPVDAGIPDDVYDLPPLLIYELVRAVIKHPKWPTDAIHASAILNEEAGELTQAAIDFHFSGEGREHMREEAIQVGAMVLRFLMNLDGYKPEGGAA